MNRAVQRLSLVMLAPLTIFLSATVLRAQSDVGGYGVTENQNFDQSSTATPTADPSTPDQFYANVYAGVTGSILTSSTLTPPTGRSGSVLFSQSGSGLTFNEYFSSQSAMDSAFGPGSYTLTVKTSTPNTYTFHPSLPTDDLTGIPIPRLGNTSWSGGVLTFDPTKSLTFTWNSSNGGNLGFQIFNSTVNQSFSSGTTSYTVPANTLSANTVYQGILQFNDASNGGYQRSTHFSMGINDLQQYSLEKVISYDQTSASPPTLDAEQPYQFTSDINNGTSGSVLTSTSLTPPVGSTGSVAYQTQSSNLYAEQTFTTKGALDAAFAAGTYNFTIQTSTPNTYTASITLGADNYPAVPQITNVTNASWSSNGVLQVTNYAQAVTFTWYNPTNTNDAYFQLNNTGVSSSGTSISNTFTIPAGSLQNNTTYEGQVQLYSSGSTSSAVPNASANAGYQTQVSFILQTGTPAASSKNLYDVQKEQVFVQTSNSAPVVGSGDNIFYDPAPYNVSFESPVTGTATGPSGTNFALAYNGYGNNFKYQSGGYTSQANLDGAAPDGTYTFPGTGGSVSLTGDLYPAVAQVTLVNGATPVWDAQGQLALDPTIANTITWSAVTVPNFSTDGHQSVEFENAGGGSVDIKESAGLTTSTTTPYTTLTIPANTMTAADTYVGYINYGQGSTFNNLGSGTYAGALYVTENYFTAVALKPQTVAFPAIGTESEEEMVALSATSSSGLPITYTVLSGPATLSGNVLTFTGAGTVTVSASQVGNGTYASVPGVTQSFTVVPTQRNTPTMPTWGVALLAALLVAVSGSFLSSKRTTG